MPEPLAMLGPVALTPAKMEQQLRGQAVDYEPVFMEAFKQVSTGRDVVVLEGGRSWREGYVAGLPAKRVVEKTNAQVLLVLKYDDTLLADRALAAQDYFGQALIGMVINKIPSVFRDHLNDTILPYLVRHNLKVLGLLPQDIMLAAPTVAELAEGLHAEILVGAEHTGELVENMMVGAMTSEAALTHFRRKRNKAVVTGGDRADIQLAALETSTRCLIRGCAPDEHAGGGPDHRERVSGQAAAPLRRLINSRRLNVAPEAQNRASYPLKLAHRKGSAGCSRRPLWVKSRHVRCKTACPLYPRKQTLALHKSKPAKGQ